MSRLDPKLLIDDILESAHKILDYTENLTFEQFMNDSKTIIICSPQFGHERSW